MILSDLISQANNATLGTSLNALLSQSSGTGITAIAIAVVGLAAAFVEYLRRSQQAKATNDNVTNLNTTTNTKVEKKADELHSQSTSRSDSFNESIADIANSLKKTDEAVKNHAGMFQGLAELFLSDETLRKVFENNQQGREFLNKVSRDVIERDKDYSAFYEKKQEIKPYDTSTDSVIRKTADTRKLLSPHYDGIPITLDTEVNNATEAMLKKTSTPSN